MTHSTVFEQRKAPLTQSWYTMVAERKEKRKAMQLKNLVSEESVLSYLQN